MSTIKAALLSFGLSGRVFHAPFLDTHAGFEFTGCWERSKKIVGQRYSTVRSYDSLEQLLGDPAIDLVVVNTPSSTHYEFARQALEHSKHVLVEKPFTNTAVEAAKLRDLARRQRRKLAAFHNRRWDSDFQSVRDVLRQGVLGDIVEANFAYARYNPALSPKAHKEQPSPGSGIVMDLGPHVIDQALLLFGMPDAVFADISITREGSRVDDYFDILLRYADKRVHLKAGYFYRQPMPEYSLFGRNGSFLKSRSDVQETQLEQGMTPDDRDYGREPDTEAGRLYTDETDRTGVRQIASPRGNYLQFYDGLYRAIANDDTEPVTATDGLRTMQVIDAAYRSKAAGETIAL